MLVGTVLAPFSPVIVPKNYYAIVEDVERMENLNLNEFTLRHVLDSIESVMSNKCMRQWPKGNLAMLQVQFEFELYIHPFIIYI